MKEHDKDCPAGRDRYHLCICEVLRLVRAAQRVPKRRLREEPRSGGESRDA